MRKNRAVRLYETFNNRPHNGLVGVDFVWSDDLVLIGKMKRIMYRSDKILPDNLEGATIDYYHDHKRGVFLFGAKSAWPDSTGTDFALPAPSSQMFASLGAGQSYCLALFFQDITDRKKKSLDFRAIGSLPYIGAHPCGNALIVTYSNQTPLIVWGSNLQITSRGIVG